MSRSKIHVELLKTDKYDNYKDCIKKFLKNGMRKKIEVRKFLGLSEHEFDSLLISVSSRWPIYEDENGYKIGWLK